MATRSSILTWEIPWTAQLVGYSPWSHKELDTSEQLTLFIHTKNNNNNNRRREKARVEKKQGYYCIAPKLLYDPNDHFKTYKMQVFRHLDNFPPLFLLQNIIRCLRWMLNQFQNYSRIKKTKNKITPGTPFFPTQVSALLPLCSDTSLPQKFLIIECVWFSWETLGLTFLKVQSLRVSLLSPLTH